MIADDLLLGFGNVDTPTKTILLCLIVYFYRSKLSRGVIFAGVKVVIQIGNMHSINFTNRKSSIERTDGPTD